MVDLPIFFDTLFAPDDLGKKHSKLYLETLNLILLSFLFFGEPGLFDLLFPIIIYIDINGMPNTNDYYDYNYLLLQINQNLQRYPKSLSWLVNANC